jgi:hypothetical protein
MMLIIQRGSLRESQRMEFKRRRNDDSRRQTSGKGNSQNHLADALSIFKGAMTILVRCGDSANTVNVFVNGSFMTI